MAQEPVHFEEDLGDIVFSAKINRLVRQDLRMARLIGNNLGTLLIEGGPSFFDNEPQYLGIARFPYDPTRSPYDRLLLVCHISHALNTSVRVWEYTLNDGASWIRPVGLGASFNNGSIDSWRMSGAFSDPIFRGQIDIDISSIPGPTWIGSRLSLTTGGTNDVSLYWGAAILYNSSFPPF